MNILEKIALCRDDEVLSFKAYEIRQFLKESLSSSIPSNTIQQKENILVTENPPTNKVVEISKPEILAKAWVSTIEAAKFLGISREAVGIAIKRNKILARKSQDNYTWEVNKDSIVSYKTTRRPGRGHGKIS